MSITFSQESFELFVVVGRTEGLGRILKFVGGLLWVGGGVEELRVGEEVAVWFVDWSVALDES